MTLVLVGAERSIKSAVGSNTNFKKFLKVGKKMSTWIYNPKPVKLNDAQRDILIQKSNSFVQSSERLKNIVNRISIKAGRIYLHHLVEQFGWDDPESQFIKPLIEGKYAEFPLARITLYDIKGDNCTADWQRHTEQWYSIYEGHLEGCLKFIEEAGHYFT